MNKHIFTWENQTFYSTRQMDIKVGHLEKNKFDISWF
jgi:hypothetical protein